MPFLEDITYDIIYDAASALSRILYQSNNQQPSIAIQLTAAEPFAFIRLFNNIVEFQNYIHHNVGKQISLFVSSVNVAHMRAVFDCDQLHNIYIFCMLPCHKTFFSRHSQTVHRKVRHIFMYDKLEYELILHGVDYCKRVADETKHENRTISNRALMDGTRLAQVLCNYFARQMDQSNDQRSEESTN